MDHDDETKRTERVDAGNQMLLRAELHTMRERIHLVERRLHDFDMAIRILSQRADAHSDELTRLRAQIELCRVEQLEMARIVARLIERLDGLITP